jgi:hypothetical protein
VPGNAHISTHAYSDIMMSLMMQGFVFDFTFIINNLSFGKQEDLNIILEKFENQGVMNPLVGIKVESDTDS